VRVRSMAAAMIGGILLPTLGSGGSSSGTYDLRTERDLNALHFRRTRRTSALRCR
jgi:hypothetical protein